MSHSIKMHVNRQPLTDNVISSASSRDIRVICRLLSSCHVTVQRPGLNTMIGHNDDNVWLAGSASVTVNLSMHCLSDNVL